MIPDFCEPDPGFPLHRRVQLALLVALLLAALPLYEVEMSFAFFSSLFFLNLESLAAEKTHT